MRWFGILMGFLLALRPETSNASAVRAFLALGAGYASLDTAWHMMGEVFLKRVPLIVSFLEAIFIGLLCYHDTGVGSPFRWYYLMSLICVAIRYSPRVAWISWGFDAISLSTLGVVVGLTDITQKTDIFMTILMLAWATWASSALAGMLKSATVDLQRLNDALRESSEELEFRVNERSEALRIAQARVIHQEKMAAFGLLSAGIAHEIGNPMSSISSLIQILCRKRDQDPYTKEKLGLIDNQLQRISRTVRELVRFSRPATDVIDQFSLAEVVNEACDILKYYQRTQQRRIEIALSNGLPPVRAIRDHLMQLILNLVFNAIDATSEHGRIRISAAPVSDEFLELTISDNGRGIRLADQCRMFQPYFTTKANGTGLGLYVCRQIVTDLGGSMRFETEEGVGTTFFLTLPIAQTSKAQHTGII
jgi:signal transduction histidine kinase